MTLQEVIDAARTLLNEPLAATRTFPDNTSTFWQDSQLQTFHNLIQEEVQQEMIEAGEEYFITQTYAAIVNGTAEYTLPTDFIKMRRVEDNRNAASPVEIYPVGINERGMFYPTNILNSQTYFEGGYYFRGNQIVLTDTPTFTNASAIRFHYVQRLTDVTAGSSTSGIPTQHHRLLVWGVVKLALFQMQADTTLANNEFEKHMLRMKQEIENRQTQRPRRVSMAVSGRGD